MQVDIFGHDSANLLVLVPKRGGNGQDVFLEGGLDIRPCQGYALVTGSLQIPGLGSDFGNRFFQFIPKGTHVFAVGESVIDVGDVLVFLLLLCKNGAQGRFSRLLNLLLELAEVLLFFLKVEFTLTDVFLETVFGTAVGARNQGGLDIEKEYEDKGHRGNEHGNHIDK